MLSRCIYGDVDKYNVWVSCSQVEIRHLTHAIIMKQDGSLGVKYLHNNIKCRTREGEDSSHTHCG